MNEIPFDEMIYTKKVRVHALQPGDMLTHDVYMKNGLLVAKAGMALTCFQIEKLKKIDEKIVTLDLRQVFSQGVRLSKKLFQDAASGKPLDRDEINALINPFKLEVYREKNIVSLLQHLKNTDDYTFQHTVNIGVLAMVIGQWLGKDGEAQHKLLLAGTLHDIGKCKIPHHILNKPGPLTGEEFTVMKQHTVCGYEILDKSGGFDEEVKQAVLQHHERIDGNGYPGGLKGEEISENARIVAVADIYHAMTTTRVYKQKANPYSVLEHLYRNISSLDPQIALLFFEKMLTQLQTHRVSLSNGLEGDIVYLDRDCISKPLVRVDDNTFIDLKKTDVTIEDILYVEQL
ncbi:MAG: HD-GYP domain-containing protein [Clostridia bacterium]|nr:HD-GYP domain-containing protein [Clostridia bacterium]